MGGITHSSIKQCGHNIRAEEQKQQVLVVQSDDNRISLIPREKTHQHQQTTQLAIM